MALKIPAVITNLPQQPAFPSRIIQSVAGMSGWWTPHAEDMQLSGAGLQAIRPVVGSRPMVQGGDALTFPAVAIGGKTRNPSYVDGVQTKFWAVDLNLVNGWNTYVCAVRVEDVSTSPEAAVIKFGTVGVLLIYPLRSTNQANGAVVSWLAGSVTGAETRLVETGGSYVATGAPIYAVVGHQTVSGAVKVSFNGGPVITSATSPAALGGGLVGAVEFGRRSGAASHGFSGQLLNFGHAQVDLLADAASMVKLRNYMAALYGMPV